MTKKSAGKTKNNSGHNEPNLDSRYGEIGISAVAAALQYKTEAKTDAKNPASAPASQQWDKWTADAA
jgi:hypothetical protein